MQGNNLTSIQEMNRSLVLRLLKKNAVSTRVGIAKQTGLQQATITNIINDFMNWGIVKETGAMESERGRRSIGIALNHDDYYVLGLRLTRRYFFIGIFNLTGKAIEVKKVLFDSSDGPRSVIRRIKKASAEMMARHNDKRILTAGMALPGPYYPESGALSAITDFPGWENVSIKRELCEFFDIPLIIDHDANAGALAEWWLAPNSISRGTMVYIAAGQGVGAGIIHDGKVFRGALGTAGEIGHMTVDISGPKCVCGNRGCLTNYASSTALINEIYAINSQNRDAARGEKLTIEQAAMLIEQQDPCACKALQRIVAYLCAGINTCICSYAPDEIIIGDELSIIGPPLAAEIVKALDSSSTRSLSEHVTIKLSSFDSDPAFIGAAALAIDYALEHTRIFADTRLARG